MIKQSNTCYKSQNMQKDITKFGNEVNGMDGDGIGILILLAIIIAIICLIIYIASIIISVAAAGGALWGGGTAILNYGRSFKENMIDSNRAIPTTI